MLLVMAMLKTPLKFADVELPVVFGSGTPEISTVDGIPGMRPVRVLLAVTVTTPEASERLLMPIEVEGWVTSTPRTAPPPPRNAPGVTNAKWPCGAMAICGYAAVFRVTCE